ncbi:DUF6221 family protein [Streptomyces sp. NPDC059534]|uniref:DUF6221 family protein n=1 Tax=Streptomyces sp. NPDC059534 TaxID=3346859 RepID=UPI0036BA9A7A
MDDLIAFLRARLDEDAAAARVAAEPESWMELNREPRPSWYVQYWADPDVAAVIADPESSAYPVVTTPEGMSEDDADRRVAHIARHDPARVLAEVDAKRRTLIRCEEALLAANPMLAHFAKETLLDLTRPYADHPDYKDTWRP